MIAMELAVEKYLIKFGHLYEDRKQDIGTESGKAITGNGLSGSEFVELLSGKQTNTHYALPPQSNFMDEGKRSYNEKLRMLTEVEKHPGEYLVEVSFQGNSIDGVMHGQHAYAGPLSSGNGKWHAQQISVHAADAGEHGRWRQ